ncbi:MAG: excinuclease ABC subunit UvrC [Maricaulaceae bacterium]
MEPTTAPDSPPREPSLKGAALIKDHVKRLPAKPGVYRMIDAKGDVIYVGKAKNLKNRVTNYTRLGGHTNRIAKMISLTAAMEFSVTATETEALLLEANLIKKHKPKFNILLRDDKSFPFILIRRDHKAPQIMKHRGARAAKGDYFGPFASAGAVNRTLDTLQKAFLLRTCSDSIYDSRTRPCMLHQIKRCAAPCVDYVTEAEYSALVAEADKFLGGKSNALREDLQRQMTAAAEAMEFEKAARLRDRIRALAAVPTHQGVNPASVEEADVVAVHVEGGASCVQVVFFRAGQNWGDRAHFPRHEKDAEPADVLEAFLAQFYDDKPAPGLILVSEAIENKPLLEEALSLRAGRKVSIHRPSRGEKSGLVQQACDNAREALGRKLAESASQARLLDGVQDVFDLDKRPERIEIYDNSHIQGTNAVGALVVAGPDGFEKNQYRKFNIKSDDLVPGDDYGMMREVFRRRFQRLLKETADRKAVWPDLVLIDGGKGQLSAVVETLADLGLGPDDVNLVAVGKGPDRDAGRETFIQPGKAPRQLPPNDAVLYYLQRLRDEAHRFAIGSHRAKRSADIAKNPLDGIPGVGPSRKKALLAHFGSARAVKRAALADLEAVDGVSKALAEKIYAWFRDET